MNNLTFQSIEQHNLIDCVRLFVQVFNSEPWNESWTEESVAARLNDCFNTPGFYGLIVFKTEAVGFALGYKERWDKSQHFYLKEMCVVSEQQGQGIGTQLMEALEQDLKVQGVQKLYLHTARETPAQAFYAGRGFYVSPKMIMMAKLLNAS